ncbi:peptidylprolyl isomerase [Luminiphilus sp.]|jgi:peptidyl-prolyl cis-trans isomerase SurA|nr:peptidylprolyl isomerase [Luminiphilus sp.]MDA8738329.1 peptidylprolyl isomerase [Luminiphilus sp.]MDA8754284.1 peptidylprolyl isomerase [Luminiphilus sp.]MDA8946586.1 peptidylprolyl isomerase [Luminiphilus sp.]MDB2313159.1 peptidylprolyl isomerase [Luminiphilus sp.]
MLNIRFKSVVAASLATLATLSATAPSIALAQMTPLDTIVAIVDEDIILASEVRDRVKQVKSSAEQRDIALPDDDTVVQETLDRLILESIQLQLADRFGVRIPDAQLDQSMTRIAAQNGLTLEQFRDALAQSGQDYVEMREGLRDELAIQRVQQGSVMRDINITEKEVDNFMTTEEGAALTEPEYRVIQALLPISRSDNAETRAVKEDFVDGVLASVLAGMNFSEAVNVQEPFAFRGGDLGWRKLSDIPSMFSQIIPSLAAGDTGKVQSNSGLHLVHLAEARGLERLVEQTDVRHILLTPNEVLGDEAAQTLILSLKERIEGGEDFAELAKEYSDDIGSAQEGGELGWTNPGQMVAEFEAAMANAEVGVITEPVRSEFGWHILEVTGRRTEDFSEQVRRNQVASYLREAKYEEELENWLREIREEAFVDIK